MGTSETYILLSLAILLLTGLLRYRQNNKLMKVARKRPTLGRLEFIRKMRALDFDYEQISAVYSKIDRWLGKEAFDIYPEDDLFKLYKMDDMDLLSIIKELNRKFKLVMPSQEKMDAVFEENGKVVNCMYLLKLLQVSPTRTDFETN